MGLFKKSRRRFGGVLIPVIGTILGMSILAAGAVGFALQSHQLVFREQKLEDSNDGRQILYIASKYLCDELNNGEKTESQVKSELKDIFEYLEITRGTNGEEPEYYLWYPTDVSARSQVSKSEDYTGTWLKATVKMKTVDDSDSSGNKDAELNTTLFSQQARIDELYNIGNLMTVYLTDENMLPGREYALNEISLVESDIDTFDEAFTYMNNKGVIMVDDIIVALYGYQNSKDAKVTYTKDADNGTDYQVVYQTGNLGGNYYWQSGTTSNTTWLYRQEYDPQILAGMMNYIYQDKGWRFCYDERVGSKVYTLDYSYDDSKDVHYLTCDYYDKNNKLYEDKSFVYYSTSDFANDLAKYVFWQNIGLLALNNISEFNTALNNATLKKAQKSDSGITASSISQYKYQWTNDGLTVSTYWRSGGRWDWLMTVDEINQVLIGLGYTDDGITVSSQKVYDALTGDVIQTYIAKQTLQQIGTVNANTIRDKVTNVHNKWDISNQVNIKYKNKNLNYSAKYSTDKMAAAIADYVGSVIYDKYVTQGKRINGSNVGYVSEDSSKLFQDFQFQMATQGNWWEQVDVVKISFHFNVVMDWNGGELRNWYSDETGDTIYLTIDEFVQTFPEEVAWCFGKTITITEETIKTVEGPLKAQLMLDLLDALRYNYLPDSTYSQLNQVIGTTAAGVDGLKEEQMYSKLLSYYFEADNSRYKDIIEKCANYQIVLGDTTYGKTSPISDTLDMQVKFKLKVDNDGDLKFEKTYEETVYFYVNYMTYSYHNTQAYNSNTKEYSTGSANNNFTSKTDNDGTEKSFFSLVPIQNKKGEKLTYNDINDANTLLIKTVIPYEKREKEVYYGDKIVSENGQDYTITRNKELLHVVDKNIIYNGTFEVTNDDDFQILVKKDCALYINGDFTLQTDQDIILEDGAMLFVNGNFIIKYEYNGYGYVDGGKTISTTKIGSGWNSSSKVNTELSKTEIEYYKSHGVDVIAGNSKIFVNGNLDYKGYKARYTTDTSIIRQYYSGSLDLLFDQGSFNATNCTIDKNGNHIHDENECRSHLDGIYIVNGDVKFRAWDELYTSDYSTQQKYYLYRNCYSNPIINATFYCDGTFNMQGLSMSSIYDTCRANFVFSKSISEPKIALNTTLNRNENSSYGGWSDTNGYLFMICEEAIDLSKVNFACVNMFTPFEQLIAAINQNQVSQFNLSEFIAREAFLEMFPDKNIINNWGLPSLLKQGFKKLYSPTDGGANISVADKITGDDNW